jgi:methyl-accepting chemotaxis protein
MTACGFAAVLFASVAIGGSASYRQSLANADAIDRESSGDLTLVQTDMDGQKRAAAAVALAIAGDPSVADLIEQNAREQIISTFGNAMPQLAENGGVQLITFVNAQGEAVARMHTPDKFGDDMKGRRKTIVSALSTGAFVAGIEPGRAAVSMFASAPVLRDGKPVGVVDAGTSLTNTYFKPLAERFGGEIAVHILIDGKFERQSSTSEGTLLPAEAIVAAFEGKPVQATASNAGREFVVKAIPFTNFSGDKIGVLEVASDVTSLVQGAQQAFWTMIISTLVAALVALIGFFLFARSLAGVLSRITAMMSRVAAGDLQGGIEGKERLDEVGAMARAVQVFKDNAVKTQELERQADEQRNLSEEERSRNAQEQQRRADAMSEATNGLAAGLKHLSSGDLTFKLDRPFADDFESLRADFNSAVEQLRGTLGSVAQATNSIDSGSREVSQSADDLSKRTEQQAASLEETAAALDQITVNVTNSAKRADEARAVAIQANERALHSGAVVANAVEAMGNIEESSQQISNIIGVIDEIAFQTNLLALNAGVEAARAGEAGKGFAVVAQEVRELAQRSAKAAKEIKELIGKSSVAVQSGVKLVSDTGDVLKTIEAYIVTINQHMDSIATSSREQSVGLSEVNTAVNQMDQVTQQNAAMVEEANAAGAALANESSRLRELISRFKLGAGASDNASGTLRAAAAAMATASPHHSPASSPARNMVRKVANAFSGGRAAATATDSWEEF